jgi:hypothetical protein
MSLHVLREVRGGDCFRCGSTEQVKFHIIQREPGLRPLASGAASSGGRRVMYFRLCTPCLQNMEGQREQLDGEWPTGAECRELPPDLEEQRDAMWGGWHGDDEALDIRRPDE